MSEPPFILFVIPIFMLTNLLFPLTHCLNLANFLFLSILPLKVQAGKQFNREVQPNIECKLSVNLVDIPDCCPPIRRVGTEFELNFTIELFTSLGELTERKIDEIHRVIH